VTLLLTGLKRLAVKDKLLLRFNCTFVWPNEPEDLILTIEGCLAGRGEDGLWVMPPRVQKPGWSWAATKWSTSVSQVLLEHFQTTKDRDLKRAIKDLGSAPKSALLTQEFKEVRLAL